MYKREDIDSLLKEIEELEKRIEALYEERRNGLEVGTNWFKENVKPLNDRQRELGDLIDRIRNYDVRVGDGMTATLYSDSHAYTIVKRTAKTLTLRRCKATLDPNWKPEFVAGGFAGHCTNQNEQRYTYEEVEGGEEIVVRWSEKLGRWTHKTYRLITLGRHEFRDYNF